MRESREIPRVVTAAMLLSLCLAACDSTERIAVGPPLEVPDTAQQARTLPSDDSASALAGESPLGPEQLFKGWETPDIVMEQEQLRLEKPYEIPN